MTGRSTPHPADAHYHANRVTAAWAAFEQAMRAVATDPPEAREAEDAKRERETTYARGELGGT